MNKKILSAALLLTLAIAFLFGGCGGGSGSSSSGESAVDASTDAAAEQETGAYSEERKLTDEDLALFTAALEGTVPVENYEVETVATQVVSGTNYRFYAKDTVNDKYVNIFIFQPLEEGAAPQLTEITDV